MTLKDRVKKNVGADTQESRSSSLAVATYFQRGSAPPPPSLLHGSTLFCPGRFKVKFYVHTLTLKV